MDRIKLTTLPIHERSKIGIGYLPQQTSIFRGLTVYENLLGIAQIVKKNVDEHVINILDHSQIQEDIKWFKSRQPSTENLVIFMIVLVW